MFDSLWCSIKTKVVQFLDGTLLTTLINHVIASNISGSNLLITTLSIDDVRNRIEQYVDLGKTNKAMYEKSIFAYIQKKYKGIALNEDEFVFQVNDMYEGKYKMKIKLFSKQDGTLILIHFPEATNLKLVLSILMFATCLCITSIIHIEWYGFIHLFAWVQLFLGIYFNWSSLEDKKLGTRFWKKVFDAEVARTHDFINFSSLETQSE